MIEKGPWELIHVGCGGKVVEFTTESGKKAMRCGRCGEDMSTPVETTNGDKDAVDK